MKKIVWLFFLFSLGANLFAAGKAEEEEIVKQNNEWILSVTDFDVSSMPEDKLSVANVITGKIVERLGAINYRTRVSAEYAYYEGYSWAAARTAAAKTLSAKQEERALMLFKGEASWKYRQNLKRVDAEIEKLKISFEEIDGNPPLINSEPLFTLTQGNLDSSFPPPPQEGLEAKFLRDQKADAFLAGFVMDFHGRFFVTIRLYTSFTRSVVWEDSIIFSVNDLESALDEITGKLLITLSGNKPASIIVKTEPEDALVLINRSFSGRANTSAAEFPPGNFTITASAPDHESITVETELAGGDLAEVNISLKPIEYSNIEIPGSSEGSVVYQGALYVGETPLTLRLPANVLEYVELAGNDGKRGTAVFIPPVISESAYSLPVRFSIPLEKGRVDKVRRHYYWAWGSTWIAGIAAWISYYTFSGTDFALRYNNTQTGSFAQRFAEDNVKMYYVSMGTMIAAGAIAVYQFVQLGRYLYMSNRSSIPVVKPKPINK